MLMFLGISNPCILLNIIGNLEFKHIVHLAHPTFIILSGCPVQVSIGPEYMCTLYNLVNELLCTLDVCNPAHALGITITAHKEFTYLLFMVTIS